MYMCGCGVVFLSATPQRTKTNQMSLSFSGVNFPEGCANVLTALILLAYFVYLDSQCVRPILIG